MSDLPAEILSEIFSLCLPNSRLDYNEVQPDPRSAPILLCHVSSSWRSIALSTPRLWSHLHYRLRIRWDEDSEEAIAWNRQALDRDIECLKWWRKNEGSRAPSIRFSFYPSRKRYRSQEFIVPKEIMDFFVEYLSSAQYLDVEQFGQSLFQPNGPQVSCPNLQSLVTSYPSMPCEVAYHRLQGPTRIRMARRNRRLRKDYVESSEEEDESYEMNYIESSEEDERREQDSVKSSEEESESSEESSSDSGDEERINANNEEGSIGSSENEQNIGENTEEDIILNKDKDEQNIVEDTEEELVFNEDKDEEEIEEENNEGGAEEEEIESDEGGTDEDEDQYPNWDNENYDMVIPGLPYLELLPFHIPASLRRLCLHHHIRLTPDHISQNTFAHLSDLTHLSLHHIYLVPDVWNSLIRAVPNLQWGYFNLYFSSTIVSGDPPECTLSSLTTLSVIVDDGVEENHIGLIFRNLHLPSLHDLSIYLNADTSNRPGMAMNINRVLMCAPAVTKLTLGLRILGPNFPMTEEWSDVEKVHLYAPCLAHLVLDACYILSMPPLDYSLSVDFYTHYCARLLPFWIDLESAANNINRISVIVKRPSKEGPAVGDYLRNSLGINLNKDKHKGGNEVMLDIIQEEKRSLSPCSVGWRTWGC
ncbi:hypothetical protein BDN70DRAFT_872825 [Pholiota conissans]|uniref:F-box domain-containing protein n=1 Tax=Pholiota conissans TaxID=109636 RepID=A0A9P5Z9Y8_9AGAR|nr:hypothetical protein BDN70DRAFT_872825 [Pholiota conissans]